MVGPVTRHTGPTDEQRMTVLLRAGFRCEPCGKEPVEQIHHRVPRQMGGSREEWINEPWNLLGVGLRCHAFIESRRRNARDNGWLVPRGTHPGAVPVSIVDGWGKRRTVLLTRDGQYRDVEPTAVSA